MLYAFLLDADPSGCPLEEQARRRLDLKLGPAPSSTPISRWRSGSSWRRRWSRAACGKLYTDDRTAAGARAGAHGAHRRPHRPAELKRLSGLMETEIARLTAEIHALAGKPFNISFAAAIGARAVRGPEAARAGEVRQGQDDLHRGRRSGRTGGGSRNRAQGAGVPPAHQAEGHLRGRAAGADRPAHRAPAHQLQPDGRGHRAALVVQSQSAEHSRSAPSWAARSAPPSCRATDGSCWWPTIRRSSCACWRTCRATRC